jgi:integrase
LSVISRKSFQKGTRYRSWLENYIKPKWAEFPLDQIKPLAVEDWLKGLSLAPKSKSHLKNLMRVLFNAAMRWELIRYQLNPMSLVRVKDGSKRKREPKALSAKEFRRMLEHIPEPFRTMCVVAMCMGLRVSEVLGLKWGDIDWEGMRVGIRQSYVYGRPGAVKTPASQRWMPLDRSLAEKLRQHQLRSAAPVNRRLDLCKPGYRKAVLARTYSGKLARPSSRKGGIRPDRLAYVSP